MSSDPLNSKRDKEYKSMDELVQARQLGIIDDWSDFVFMVRELNKQRGDK